MHIGATEAAERLGVSRQRVHQLLKSGTLRGERRNIMGVTVWAIDERSITERINGERETHSALAAFPGEEWRQIPGAALGYRVSSLGRIGSPKQILKTPIGAQGYPRVGIQLVDGRRSTASVHTYVARAFLPPPPGRVGQGRDKYVVNHRNGDKTDNRVANLEWCTPLENVRHAIATGLRAPATGHRATSAVLTEHQVRQIRRMYLHGVRGRGTIVLGKVFGVNPETIRNVVLRRTWGHID